MVTETPTRGVPEDGERGIDGWLHRYSRWKERRLTHMAELPLPTLALQSLYLCVCILLDGVLLPWVVVAVASGFSDALFAVLLVPVIVAEGVVYQRMKAREIPPA